MKQNMKNAIGLSLKKYNETYMKQAHDRIDNIVAQAGTDNTEIVDARIDSAGITHTTLNNRILAETKMNDEQLVTYTGSYISAEDTMQGYLKDVEIKGNTVQDPDSLADIRSVGDKVEGQELYEIPVLSCGKNLFNPLNKNIECSIGESQNKVTYKVEGDKIIIKSNPSVNSDWGWIEFKNIKVTPNKSYTIHPNATVIKGNTCVFVYDGNNTKLFEIPNISKTFIPTTKHISIRLYVQTATLYTDAEIHYKPQLEEGTQATSYEPYVEDKLTILSPVQLEKVGDVADRIVCRDGVWGVEKNIKTVRLGSESAWYSQTNKSGIKLFTNSNYLSNGISNRVILCDALTVNNGVNQDVIDGYNQILVHKNANYSKNIYISKDFENPTLFTAWLDENPVNIKCVTETQPQFIPLPHDQQIKLRTFANKTNISFLTEIEGSIKAQVPKSIGATVNTHTEQINNLNKELDRVKKLEENTVSTVTTESDFTTVEATSNGYFEDVKLEGKTLVVNSDNEVVESGTDGAMLKSVGDGVDEISVESVKGDGNLLDENVEFKVGHINTSGSISSAYKHTAYTDYILLEKGDYCINTLDGFKPTIITIYNSQKVFKTQVNTTTFTLTESSYIRLSFRTLNDTEISVANIKNVMLTKGTIPKPYTSYQSDKKRLLYYNDETQTWEKPILRRWDSIEKHADGKYYYHQRSGEVVLNGSESWAVKSDLPTDNPQGTHMVFYVEDTTFPISVRPDDLTSIVWISDIIPSISHTQGWYNSIEGLHFGTFNIPQGANNCRYFINILKSKLSTQDVQGFKQWLQANNVTVVYQLAQEKVYECTNIDLITYNGETNYIVESGAIVPRTTLKVHSNISNVVSLLQKKVSLLESDITSYMITQNRLMLASRYNSDTVSFKVDCSEAYLMDNIVDEDLFSLLYNVIIVGKDNYDYDKMLEMMDFYVFEGFISWDMWDYLYGIIDLQHNPPTAEEGIEDSIE